MKAKTVTLLYHSTTLLFAVAMLLDGVGGVLRVQAGQEVMHHLGYPLYVLTIFGVAKLLGAVALLQTRFRTIKEWAYAGFTFNFLGAFASRAFVGDELSLLLPPLVMQGLLLLTYFLWKKATQQTSAAILSIAASESAAYQAA